jgi:hypothetical protein
MKTVKLKKVLVSLAVMSIMCVIGCNTRDKEAAADKSHATATVEQKEIKFKGSAAFNDPDDGDVKKNQEWNSSGIVIGFTLSKDRKTVSNLTIDVSYAMKLSGLTVQNPKHIIYGETIPFINDKLSLQIDNEDCLCNLQLTFKEDSATGTVEFTYKFALGEHKFSQFFGKDPITFKAQ